MKEYRIELNGKIFFLNEKELFTQASNFCIKLMEGQFDSILDGFKKDGAIITEINLHTF